MGRVNNWLNTDKSYGRGNDKVALTIAKNETETKRETTFTIKGKQKEVKVKVSQGGIIYNTEIRPSAIINVDWWGTKLADVNTRKLINTPINIEIITNYTTDRLTAQGTFQYVYDVFQEENVEYCIVDYSSSDTYYNSSIGGYSFSLTIQPNPTNEQREINVTFLTKTSKTPIATIKFIQAPNPYTNNIIYLQGGSGLGSYTDVVTILEEGYDLSHAYIIYNKTLTEVPTEFHRFVYFDAQNSKGVIFPTTITKVADKAFMYGYNSASLGSGEGEFYGVALRPKGIENITEIGYAGLAQSGFLLDDYVLNFYKNLKHIGKNGLTYHKTYTIYGGGAYYGDANIVLNKIESLGDKCFYGFTANSLTIGNNKVVFEGSPFNGCSITKLMFTTNTPPIFNESTFTGANIGIVYVPNIENYSTLVEYLGCPYRIYPPLITLSENLLTFTRYEYMDYQTINVTSSKNWTFETDYDWINVIKENENTLKINTSFFTSASNQSRYGEIKLVIDGNVEEIITIFQTTSY